MTDLATLSVNKLKVLEALIKLEINSNYHISPEYELVRFNQLRVRLDAIRSEIKRRSII
jgi:hypothetical protein